MTPELPVLDATGGPRYRLSVNSVASPRDWHGRPLTGLAKSNAPFKELIRRTPAARSVVCTKTDKESRLVTSSKSGRRKLSTSLGDVDGGRQRAPPTGATAAPDRSRGSRPASAGVSFAPRPAGRAAMAHPGRGTLRPPSNETAPAVNGDGGVPDRPHEPGPLINARNNHPPPEHAVFDGGANDRTGPRRGGP